MVILSRYTCDRNSLTLKFCIQAHKSSSATKSLSRRYQILLFQPQNVFIMKVMDDFRHNHEHRQFDHGDSIVVSNAFGFCNHGRQQPWFQ